LNDPYYEKFFVISESFSEHSGIIGSCGIKGGTGVMAKNAILCHEYGTIGFGVFQEKRVVSYAKTN
jgi:hypothetical protein